MISTDMYLSGVSLSSCLQEASFREFSSKELFVESCKTSIKPLSESRIISLEDDLKTTKREELFRDEEHGFVVYKEYSKLCPDGIEMAYNLDGKFIGSPKEAEVICVNKGIRPETYDDNRVCSIGFNDKEQAWYGWSHRAFSKPFTIGYTIKDNDDICTGCFGPNEKSLEVGFTAKTLDDCKKLAIAFAYSVD